MSSDGTSVIPGNQAAQGLRNPSCLELLTFLILGELSLQSLQLCVDLALLGFHITETLFQLLGLIPQIILGKEVCGTQVPRLPEVCGTQAPRLP